MGRIYREKADPKATRARYRCSMRTIQRRLDAFQGGIPPRRRAEASKIVEIVCDCRRGLTRAFGGFPVQMCMFHPQAIIRRYLTLKPMLEASQALVKIVDGMKNADRASFLAALARWEAQ